MRWAAWIVGAALFFTWAQTILAFAVFAVPERYDGAEAVIFSLITVGIGVAVPVGVVWALRTQGVLMPPRERNVPPAEPVRDTASDAAPVHQRVTADVALERPAEAEPVPALELEPLAEPLTERELEVLRLVADGKSNKEVAQDLVISLGTVKTHTNNLYRKLGARNRAEAVASGRRYGLL